MVQFNRRTIVDFNSDYRIIILLISHTFNDKNFQSEIFVIKVNFFIQRTPKLKFGKVKTFFFIKF